MTPISLDQLLYEVEDVLRSMPGPRDFCANPEKVLPWLGRANAAMNAWDGVRTTVHFEPLTRKYSETAGGRQTYDYGTLRQSLIVMLHQAQSDLRLRSAGPLSVAVQSGAVFQYFDEVRKLIESARSDLFFVDPYIDAEFVSRYLPYVPDGTGVRILAREKLETLKPALAAYVAQYGRSVEVRSARGFHDRYIFVDAQACYQSGASFKDGAKKAPTTLTQITDAFQAVQATYQQCWDSSTPV